MRFFDCSQNELSTCPLTSKFWQNIEPSDPTQSQFGIYIGILIDTTYSNKPISMTRLVQRLARQRKLILTFAPMLN